MFKFSISAFTGDKDYYYSSFKKYWVLCIYYNTAWLILDFLFNYIIWFGTLIHRDVVSLTMWRFFFKLIIFPSLFF